MGITKGARSTAIIVLFCLLMAGCSAEQADRGPASSPSPSASPSASATWLRAEVAKPSAPLAGGCNELAALAGVTEVVGGVQRVTTLDALWQVAIETSGGLTCSLLTTRAAAQVYVLPDALVQGRLAELTSRSACDETARAMECRASVASAGSVTLVAAMFARGEDPDAALAVVSDLAAATAAAVGPGASAPERATTWRVPVDCAQIAQTIGITSILGSEKVRPFVIPDSAARIESRLDQSVMAASRCDWSRKPSGENDHGSRFSVVAVPGGAWAWKRFSTRIPDSAPATVAGFPARVTSGGDVYISDGVNLLHLEGSGLAGISVVDTSGGVLSVLDASAHGGADARD